MNWRIPLAALFVVLALTGCAPRRADRDRRGPRPIRNKNLATPAVCTDQVGRRIGALGPPRVSG
jgi:hypothetical protein